MSISDIRQWGHPITAGGADHVRRAPVTAMRVNSRLYFVRATQPLVKALGPARHVHPVADGIGLLTPGEQVHQDLINHPMFECTLVEVRKPFPPIRNIRPGRREARSPAAPFHDAESDGVGCRASAR